MEEQFLLLIHFDKFDKFDANNVLYFPDKNVPNI